jgi:NTP pyrophosphatase (non-canonical NTP hydrolase)
MLEAEKLHREAALLSNTLADFADDDVEGRRPVVEKIMEIRERWKDARYELQTGQKRRPEKPAKPTVETVAETSKGLRQAELRLEIQRHAVNISKKRKNLAEQPEHSRASTWQAYLARLEAIKEHLEDELRQLSYVTATE